MEKLRILRRQIAQFMAQRWAKEIMLAAMLTVAAAVFIVTAIVRKDAHPGQTTPYDTAQPQR